MSPVSMCKRLLGGILRVVALPLLRVLALDMVSPLFAYTVKKSLFRYLVSESQKWFYGSLASSNWDGVNWPR